MVVLSVDPASSKFNYKSEFSKFVSSLFTVNNYLCTLEQAYELLILRGTHVSCVRHCDAFTFLPLCSLHVPLCRFDE
jgi:hypothetical protein